MNDFTKSVCLIVNESSSSWGSGFSIYQDDGSTYVVTCAHVVGSAQEHILVNGKESEVVAIGEGWVDIAVLKVQGLEGKPPLKPCSFNEPKRSIKIPGISKLKDDRALRILNGILGDPLQLMSTSGEKVVDAWDLKLDDGEYAIKEGYSGSPVIDVETNGVIGIVSHRVEKGEKGIAIAIGAVQNIWVDMPGGMLRQITVLHGNKTPMMSPVKKGRLERLERSYAMEQAQQTRLIEKLDRWQRELGMTANLGQKVELEHQIQQIQQELKEVEKRLNDLENKIDSLE
jgi:S1-C subfamily serine protease